MEEDTPVRSEAPPRRSKRARVQTTGAASNRSTKNTGRGRKESADPPDQSPNQDEREDSFEDFEEPRPKAKRVKTTEGASAAVLKDDISFIEVIRSNSKLIPQVVKLWLGQYETNKKSAMAELLMTLFEACGAKYQIRGEFIDETDVDDVVVALVNMAKRGDVEDYQTSKKKDFKNFKDSLTTFWDNLVSECQNGPLFDEVFDKCIDYIIALSCTPPRIYRQIASLTGLQIVTSLIDVARVLGEQRETTQRQLNAEMKKRTEGPRVESLNKRLSATHEQITVIEEMMRKIFTGLFVHRYRDIDPDVRMSCIQSLGIWVLSYPSLFLQDLYLKYLGWTLNDKNAGVRKASIFALQSLYEVDDNVPSLGLFTERFSARMIELADDVDISVSVCAIGLIKQLLRHQLLNEDDLGSLYDLLIDDPPEIRRAIGSLVYEHLIAQNFNSSQSHTRGEETASSEVHLGRMLQILREFSTDQILSNYVIDDVWEYMNAMKDWKCIISMLLDENPLIELTDEDATNLIRLLCASVKKAVGERIVPATDNRKQYYNKAQKELIDTDRRNITIAMMKRYPQLLSKYMADKAKIAPLVEIITHMNLELYSLKRQEQNFKSAVQMIKEAFLKHADKDALRSCVKAIHFCSNESRGDLRDFAQNKLKELEDELTTKLKSAIRETVEGDDESDEYTLLLCLKRLYELQLSRPVSIESLYEEMSKSLPTFRNVNIEVVIFLLLNMYLHVAWSLHSIINSDAVSEESLFSLSSKRTALLQQLEYFLQNPSEIQGEGRRLINHLACRVCILLSEMWCLFRKSNFASTKLEILEYSPDQSILRQFWGLCEQQLKISDEAEDDDVNAEYIEETNRDAVMIAAAKLVATDAVPKGYLGPEIISHFVMHGSSVAEIIKNLVAVLKKKEDDISNIFKEAVIRAHQRYMKVYSESNDESLAGKSFQECKDLAARLSGTFVGIARKKYRPDILKIVKEGIEYAFTDAPKRLSFLEGALIQFVMKLPASDILDILRDVQGRTEFVNTEVDPSGWRPYHTFVNSLQEKYAKNDDLQDEKEGATVRRRGRPRKKRDLSGKKLFDDQISSEEEEENASDQEEEEEEEEEEMPLIHSIKSAAKLRNLRVSRDSVPAS
ncbi:sister-chromatid cohesion protein 3 [Impatiens glandulifera]|uniref:sister-chromatid cohesion protein 3 n=1 Tax=Impatiens glandulifera TaxID=253017 RepID=UPI001FB10233|nr:sister-chromatid cohesion protein 3 [Impatiens glandulifera]